MRLGENDQALSALKEGQRLSKNPARAAMIIANVQIKLERYMDALKSLRQALRGSKRPALVHKQIGDLWVTLGKYPEAIEEYRAVLLSRPELREKQPELTALIDKAVAAEENESLAKQIQASLASLSAARREGANKLSNAPEDSDRVATRARRRARLRPFRPVPRKSEAKPSKSERNRSPR
jgi:tetratricopeptide (TPR) repeat protein